MRLVWLCHKVRFWEVMVVLGMRPKELMQCTRLTSELVQGGAQQTLILELILMEI